MILKITYHCGKKYCLKNSDNFYYKTNWRVGYYFFWPILEKKLHCETSLLEQSNLASVNMFIIPKCFQKLC